MGTAVRLEKRLENKLERLPRDERAPRWELISGLAQFVVSVDSSERLGKLAEALESLPKVGEEGASKEAALEAARMRNLVRVLQDRARLKEESFRTGEVEGLLVVGRERLRHMREKGEILGVVRGERRPTLYPRWQFGADGEILEGLPEIISAAREVGMGPEELHFFMTEPDERLGGEPPVDLLRRGEAERVADLLLSAGLGPFQRSVSPEPLPRPPEPNGGLPAVELQGWTDPVYRIQDNKRISSRRYPKPRYRFDAPDGEYAVFYASDTKVATFPENYAEKRRRISVADAKRHLVSITPKRLLPLVDLRDDRTLSALDLDARISVGDDYEACQQWALAFHNEWSEVCGIAYAARWGGVRTTNVVLFVERCRDDLAVDSLGRLGDPALENLVLEAADRYKLRVAFLAQRLAKEALWCHYSICKGSKARKRTHPWSWKPLGPDLHPEKARAFSATVGWIAMLLLLVPGSTRTTG